MSDHSAFRRLNNALARWTGLRLQRARPAPSSPKLPLWRFRQVLEEISACCQAHGLAPIIEIEENLELLAALQGNTVSEALWIAARARASIGLPGSVCEFGVAAGTTSALLAAQIMNVDKDLWLFDSFEGLPHPTPKDALIDDFWGLGSIDAYAGTMAFSREEVLGRLAGVGFPRARTHIIAGFIEETISSAHLPEHVCFAFVDFDFYEPICVALDFLHRTLAPGGHIVVDDYGYFSSGAKEAVDEFLAKVGSAFEVERPPPWAGHFVVLKRVAA